MYNNMVKLRHLSDNFMKNKFKPHFKTEQLYRKCLHTQRKEIQFSIQEKNCI